MSQHETWVNNKWRPAMAWTYIAICAFDFIIAPIINYAFFGKTGVDFVSWKPLTMSDGGMFHMAMGAVLGVTAWQRGREKLARYGRGRDYEEREYDYVDTADFRDSRVRHSSRED